MSFKSKTISKLLNERTAREGYLRAKLNQLIPSQIRALRLREGWTQTELGQAAEMKQARISAAESPGSVNFSLETLIRLAAAFRVGLQVRFVPYSELLNWENNYSQDKFAVTTIENDSPFIRGESSTSDGGARSSGLRLAMLGHRSTEAMRSPIFAEMGATANGQEQGKGLQIENRSSIAS